MYLFRIYFYVAAWKPYYVAPSFAAQFWTVSENKTKGTLDIRLEDMASSKFTSQIAPSILNSRIRQNYPQARSGSGSTFSPISPHLLRCSFLLFIILNIWQWKVSPWATCMFLTTLSQSVPWLSIWALTLGSSSELQNRVSNHLFTNATWMSARHLRLYEYKTGLLIFTSQTHLKLLLSQTFPSVNYKFILLLLSSESLMPIFILALIFSWHRSNSSAGFVHPSSLDYCITS